MNENKRAKMIAIEGIDGSGKSMQYNMLCEKLKEEGNKCLEVSFPQYDDFFGIEIGKMLSGKNSVRADNVDAKSMSLWYALDRFNKISNINFDEYDFILCNRYTLSNVVYQSLRSNEQDSEVEKVAEWIFKLEHEQLKLPQPDLYFIMDIDRNTSKVNVSKKGHRDYVGYEMDVYEKSDTLISNARRMYLTLAEKRENIIVINCMDEGEMLSPQKIHKRILEHIKHLSIKLVGTCPNN